MGLLTAEHKAAVGRTLPPVRAEVTRRDIRRYAASTGQRLERYLAGDEAPPLFLFGLFFPILPREQLLEDGRNPDTGLLPPLPLKRVMAGGTEAEYHRRIHPGDVLLLHQTLIDLYEKAGSQGPLIFAVVENRVETEAGDPVMTERVTRIVR